MAIGHLRHAPRTGVRRKLLDLARIIQRPPCENATGLAYLLLHRRRVADEPDRLYDMSNLLIVTPKAHQEVLSRRLHFGRRRRQRSEDRDSQ